MEKSKEVAVCNEKMKGQFNVTLLMDVVGYLKAYEITNKENIEQNELDYLRFTIHEVETALIESSGCLVDKLVECIMYCKNQHETSGGEIFEMYSFNDFNMMRLLVEALLR